MTRAKLRVMGWITTGMIAGVALSTGLSALAQREGKSALPLDELRQFAEVYGAVKAHYVEPVEDKKLIHEAISGMLSGLDPHSSYLDAEAFKELQVGTQGEFGGLGIEVGVEDGFIRVVSPIEDTPAARAGIQAGDLIIKIDDKATKGLGINDAVKLMRGAPKTRITLTLSRKGVTQPIVVTLERDIIRVQSVRTQWVAPGYGFVRITQFQEHTLESLVDKVNALLATAKSDPSKPIKGLVLDLRNDPGGLLHAAIGVSAAFLPKDVVVVKTDGRQEDAKRSYLAIADDYRRTPSEDPLPKLNPLAKTLPMVVLINAGSASASEIVAGALQDHGRAKLLGTQSFGKGSVQTILPLTRSTAIKLTTALYYTPKGRSIQAKGIEPDFWVEETAEGDVIDRFRLREADLSGHLGGQKGGPKAEQKTEPGAAAREGRTSPPPKPITFGSAEDYQLQQALAHLQGQPVAIKTAKP
ncbi:MAG: hypothetical protein RLZZ290_94 [Pseudomonadota bacterium]|jgi:carboxyl-terminal processing protease